MSVRKLLSISLALSLVYSISLPARAELLKNFKTDGSIETRSFGIDNEVDRNGTADDYRSETRTRIMIGANFDLLDDVHSRVLLSKNNRLYGQGSESISTVQNTVFVDNAYAKIDKVFGHVDLTMGRQFYGDSNDLVVYFGPQNDDVLSITALDAFRADADIMGVAKFQGIAGKLAETGATGASVNSAFVGFDPVTGNPIFANTPANNSNTDTDLFGAELNTDKLIPAGNLAAYYYTKKTHANKPPAFGNNTLNVYGLRAAGDVPVTGLSYNGEVVMNGGRNNIATTATTPGHGYGGNAYFLGLKYGHDIMAGKPVRAHIEYGRGSDNFASIASARRFGIIWGEHTSLGVVPTTTGTLSQPSNANGVGGPGLTNLKVLDAGVGMTPIGKLGIDLNWYRFRYDANLGNRGTSAGTEYDLIVSWKHSENVSLEANAATFKVGTSLQNIAPNPVAPTNPITRLGADVKIKF